MHIKVHWKFAGNNWSAPLHSIIQTRHVQLLSLKIKWLCSVSLLHNAHQYTMLFTNVVCVAIAWQLVGTWRKLSMDKMEHGKVLCFFRRLACSSVLYRLLFDVLRNWFWLVLRLVTFLSEIVYKQGCIRPVWNKFTSKSAEEEARTRNAVDVNISLCLPYEDCGKNL